jgi:hypothetical protein
MAELDIGYFGDERLKKLALGLFNACPIGRRSAFATWGTIGPRR